MAELRGDTVLGLHNWLYFAEQEQQGHVDYKGWISRADTGRVFVKLLISYASLTRNLIRFICSTTNSP